MVRDLMQRVAEAQTRPREDAARSLAALWTELGEHASVARLAIAHALADLQDDPEEELKWDLRALTVADRLTDGDLAHAGIEFPTRALYPSLHLNAGEAYRKAGELDNARTHARKGRAALNALGEDPYGGMLTDGFARLEARIEVAQETLGAFLTPGSKGLHSSHNSDS
jgi:hypothetical protein